MISGCCLPYPEQNRESNLVGYYLLMLIIFTVLSLIINAFKSNIAPEHSSLIITVHQQLLKLLLRFVQLRIINANHGVHVHRSKNNQYHQQQLDNDHHIILI